MARRLLYAVAWGIAGYLVGVMVSFTAMSIALESKLNNVSNHGTRDRWAFILALVGLFGGAAWGWWRTGAAPDDDR